GGTAQTVLQETPEEVLAAQKVRGSLRARRSCMTVQKYILRPRCLRFFAGIRARKRVAQRAARLATARRYRLPLCPLEGEQPDGRGCFAFWAEDPRPRAIAWDRRRKWSTEGRFA